MRAILQHDYGVGADQIEWYFGGYDKPENYTERVPIELPPNVRSTTISSQQSLDQMLDQGEIDALMGASAPPSFLRGSPNVGRLFRQYRDAEIEYYRRTGIFPITHMVVIKREIYERAPWVAASLYKAFVEAKAVGRRRLRQYGHLYCALPWLRLHLEETDALMGDDPFVYGLEANRPLLETFLSYSLEQEMIDRPLTVDELFAPETHDSDDAPSS
jgi:4,5-dihydroxyphthalate decarboxylase